MIVWPKCQDYNDNKIKMYETVHVYIRKADPDPHQICSNAGFA